jgi:hypothetical protein
MKKHTKLYYDSFGYAGDEFIACEVCGARAVDIHHISCRGMGNSQKEERIDNLMAVCRKCHIEYGDKKQYIEMLYDIHFEFMRNYGKIK